MFSRQIEFGLTIRC